MDLSHLKLEDFLIISGISILAVFGLISLIGNIRQEEIKKNLKDPFKTLIKDLQTQVNELLKMSWPEYQAQKSKVCQALTDSIEQLQIQKKSIKVKPLALFETKAFCPKERLVQIVSFEFAQQTIDGHLATLKDILPTQNTDTLVKHNHYYQIDPQYRQITQQTESWKTAVELFDLVQEEINEAQSAVSSAQTMETIDLFSKNKEISVLSSMSNSSADGEIRDIRPALTKLQKHLESLKISNQTLIKELKVFDLGDLVTDLCFDFSFDFMSMFSLFNLSSAQGSLSSLERELAPLGSKIKSTFHHHESLKNNYLNKLS